MALHPHAAELIRERMRDVAQEQGQALDLDKPENQHRLLMGVFPRGAAVIPNPYNKIAGFSCAGRSGGAVHFVPGFPVMAWPMMEWVLDTYYARWFCKGAWLEQSVIVFGAMEASLTPLMETVEAQFEGVKVFSLPSVDHPEYGKHIELGVKGASTAVAPAYGALKTGLVSVGALLGPELVRAT
jgi:molybdopterin-biosynthesis enzyme MoeA-like protein